VRNIQPILDELAALFPAAGVKPENGDAARPQPDTAEIPADDQELLARMFASKHGEKLRRLWDGNSTDHGEDRSRADLALCDALAFWCGPDPSRIDRLFRGSKLYRSKWDEKRKDSTYGAETIRKALAGRTEFRRGRVALVRAATHTGARDLESQPPPSTANDGVDNPHRLAQVFLASLPENTLRFYRSGFVGWRAGVYSPVPDDDIRGRVTAAVREEFVRANETDVAVWAASEKKGGAPQVRKVTSRLVGDVINALRSLVAVPHHVTPPAWLDGESGPPPADVLAMPNGLLDIPSGTLHAPSPSFFTFNAVGFDFDPKAPTPAHWERFLLDVWGDGKDADMESVSALQEWFGYLLTADTRQQKLLMLIGPRRAGKGTITRVLRELVGERNYSGPTLNGLAAEFGLAPLLNKTAAVISDARISGRADTAVVVERLLSITGEDTITVNRKHLPAVDAKLTTRFVIVSNELPKLGDASGALAGRMILLRLTRTFYGQEDTNLAAKLTAELPGILLWALDGLKRLRARGRFEQPKSGAELLEDMEEIASPVGAFVNDRCVLDKNGWTAISALFAEWKKWCDEHGREHPGNEQSFCRDLRAVAAGLTATRPRQDSGKRVRGYNGIRILEAHEQ
jgi:putative DNA primase/helicase